MSENMPLLFDEAPAGTAASPPDVENSYNRTDIAASSALVIKASGLYVPSVYPFTIFILLMVETAVLYQSSETASEYALSSVWYVSSISSVRSL